MRHPWLQRAFKPAIALAACGGAAWLVALVSQGRPWRGLVPFAFLLVVWAAGLIGGRSVGVLGSIMAALIFAFELFGPLGNLAVHDQQDRSNLAWMLLAGVTISYLLLPFPAGPSRRER